jgi:hypothetical protein
MMRVPQFIKHLSQERRLLHNKVKGIVLYLNGGKCDEWLRAGARADTSSTEEEDVATGRTASNGIGGWVVCITEAMKSQLLSPKGDAFVCNSMKLPQAGFSIFHVCS